MSRKSKCCTLQKLLRFLLYGLNFILLLSTTVCLICSAILWDTLHRYAAFHGNPLAPLVVVFTIISGLIVLLTLFGLFAVFVMNPFTIQLYIYCTAISTVIMTGCAVASILYVPKVDQIVENILGSNMLQQFDTDEQQSRLHMIEEEVSSTK
ncbi:hypothetical protein D915_007994 [Fasciola hepatica]|uniref:Tetraspanin family protein n=1 Tax=Fasciola hepatica TaxID=6192 RepID=A0A4E0RGY1_FASHE|nr:hypothetical protein D915_007994 [Fasciola hepatica]